MPSISINSLESPPTYIDDLLDEQHWDDQLFRCHCYALIALIITISISLIFVELYGVEKLCYKYVHPDMQAIGDFRDHDHQSYNTPIC